MPWPKRSIPKFGNWDKNEDISYSIVFDQVRAEKEALSQSLDEEYESPLSSRSLSPQSYERKGNKSSQRFPPFGPRRRKEKLLQKSEKNGSFLISQQSGGSKQRTEKGRFHNKHYESSAPAFSSWQSAVLRDHQNVGTEPCLHKLHACTHNVPGVCAHNCNMSGLPLRHSGATERQHPDQGDQTFEGMQYTKSLGSGRHLHGEELTDVKLRNPTVGNFEMGSTVPKFGDWEKEDGFTMVFDNMRKERSSKRASRRSIVRVGQVQTGQDLYKGSEEMKHQRVNACFGCKDCMA